MDLCSMAIGSILWFCPAEVPEQPQMPENEPDAVAFNLPEPPKPEPKPEPKPTPNFRPVVIEKKVIIERPAPPPPPPPPEPEFTGPSPEELALAAKRARFRALLEGSYVATGAGSAQFVATTTKLEIGKASRLTSFTPSAGTKPLDLRATISSRTDDRYKKDGVTSSGPVDNSRIIASDRYINVQLEGGINTQLDGLPNGLVLVVTDTVYGAHGRKELLPQGSRFECGVTSLEQIGSTRASIECKRVRMAESRAEVYEITAAAVDAQGHAGTSGEVNNRWGERIGSATGLAAISAAVRGATASLSTSESDSNVDSAITTSSEELSQRFGEISAAVLEKTINLKPFLKKAQGSPLVLRPSTDWYLKKVE